MRLSPSRTAAQPLPGASPGLEVAGTPVEGHSKVSALPLYWPLVFGLLGALGLTVLYLGSVTLVASWAHALELFREDAPFVVPTILGFGIQVGLFTYLKLGLHLANGTHAAGALTGTAGGTSTLAMVACCAHHVTDVLPLVGLSGAAIFLAQYKVPFMVVGLLSNVVGIGVLLAMVWKAKMQVTFEGGCH